MDRSQRHVVVVGVAVLTAALASFGVFLTLKRMPVREVEVARSFVVVAARALPTGVRLKAADLKVVPWPAGNMVQGSFSKVDAVVNRGLLSSVVENEPMVESKLAGAEGGAGLPSAIPPGMRAMSVKVNDVIGVAGFLDPGTRVDLMVTIRRKDDSTSRTVVSNVQVLTAGTRGDQQRPKDAKTQTGVSGGCDAARLARTPSASRSLNRKARSCSAAQSARHRSDCQFGRSGRRPCSGSRPEPAPVVKAVSVPNARAGTAGRGAAAAAEDMHG